MTSERIYWLYLLLNDGNKLHREISTSIGSGFAVTFLNHEQNKNFVWIPEVSSDWRSFMGGMRSVVRECVVEQESYLNLLTILGESLNRQMSCQSEASVMYFSKLEFYS
jgi:hypothetical protein